MADRWIDPVLVRTENGKNTERKALNGKTDDFGTFFKADIHTNYTDGSTYPIGRLWQEDRNGNIVGDRLLFRMPKPPGESIDVRLDDLSMTIAGHDVHVDLSGHGATDETTHLRNQYDMSYVWVGVYNPGGHSGEREGAETFIPVEAGGGGGSTGMTEADFVRIQGMITDAVTTIAHNIIPKDLLAFDQAGLAKTHDMEAGGDYGIFQQLINTGWSANMVSAYLLGEWDGRLPDGSVWHHPLTGQPITNSPQWVKK